MSIPYPFDNWFFINFFALWYYHLKIRLYRHKEQLKKDILKKRVLLEKELQIEIQKELVHELASRTKIIKQEDVRTITSKTNNNIGSATIAAVKRKSGGNIVTAKTSAKSNANTQQSQITTSNDKIKTSSNKGRKGQKVPTGKKKEKLYCICRTPYDDSK